MATMTRRVVFVAISVSLLASAVVYVLSGLRVYAQYRAAHNRYMLSCDNLIVWSPPTKLYVGMYSNQPALMTIRVHAPAGKRAMLTVTVTGATQSQTISLASAGEFQTVTLKPPLDPPSTLENLVGPGQRASEIKLTLQSGGRVVCSVSAPITVMSRQWIQWRDPETGADLSAYVAGWVTPHASVIADLVGHASQRLVTHPELYDGVPALYGYDQGVATPQQVRGQVDALFDALAADYHVRYAADNVDVTLQRAQIIQLPRDILTAVRPTGMCVETSVLLASAVERLGMRPFIVFTSTHAFLGVAAGDGAHATIMYWETSDLNGDVLGAQANVDGEQEYAADQANHSLVGVVDIAYQRSRGIVPME